MYFGQTSNWKRQVKEITSQGKNSVPMVATQYNDGVNAIRVHCGSEALVLLKVQFYLTNEGDYEALDAFLERFSLPRNGYQVVQAPPMYQQPYPVSGVSEVPSAPIQLVGPSNQH